MNRKELIAAMEAAASVKPKAVHVQGWKGTVYIRALTVAEVEEQTADTENTKDKRRIARGACRVICDENGERVFDPDSDEDVTLLSRQPWAILQGVLAEANKFNGVSEEGAADAKNG